MLPDATATLPERARRAPRAGRGRGRRSAPLAGKPPPAGALVRIYNPFRSIDLCPTAYRDLGILLAWPANDGEADA
ncbi:MAG: hypothetical protein IT372_31535 [Polyangiaceae bacterium]|nr:hypothetical protein [Polyangiaceae bacterium]